MTEKLSFFDWYELNEKLPHEEHNTKWIENYAKNLAWKSYRTGQAVHDGDCTNCPYTCSLCELTDALQDYRDYFFDTSDISRST